MIFLITTLEPARIDLLPQFVAHYRGLGVERFLLSLHVDPSLGAEAAAQVRARFEAVLKRLGIGEAYYYTGPFDAVPFYLYQSEMQARHVKPEDWIVWADADEFHIYPVRPADIIPRLDALGVNYVGGLFIDRIAADGGLPEFDPARSIWEQFPLTTIVTKELAGGDPKKVVLAKGWLQLSHGSHVPAIKRIEHAAPLRQSAEPHPGLNRADGWIQVHHFKWDASVIARLRQRVTPEWKAKHSYWTESQRLLDYFEAHGLKFDLKDLPILRLSGAQPLY